MGSSERKATPLDFAEYAKGFSIACADHGTDYVSALPESEWRKIITGSKSSKCKVTKPKTWVGEELHVFLGFDAPLSECCKRSVDAWRWYKEAPQKECCLAVIDLFRRKEENARGLTFIREGMLPKCCREALEHHRWWLRLERAGGIELLPSARREIVTALYRVSWAQETTTRTVGRDIDEFILATARVYGRAGGQIRFARNGSVAAAPSYSAFLSCLRHSLPPHMQSSPAAIVRHAREVLEGRRQWNWDPEREVTKLARLKPAKQRKPRKKVLRPR